MEPVRLVLAPDKFKGALTAAQAVEAMERGVTAATPGARCIRCPMADGGEGTVDTFLQRGAQRRVAKVRGPRGKPVEAVFALDGNTAICEMASASGLELLQPSEHDPARADTFGTGELLRAVLGAGATHVILGIGGSATNDAGIGMLRALGVRFFDAKGDEIAGAVPEYCALERIDASALDERFARKRIEVAVDVDNPLCGPNGASRAFGPQKGATPEQVDELDAVLAHVADVVARTVGHDLRDVPGAGAAGGLGFALIAFLGAQLERGVELIARQAGLYDAVQGAALCLTGEGKIDAQTLHGKTVDGVARIAQKAGADVIAFGGVVEDEAANAFRSRGVRTVATAPADMPKEEAMRSAGPLLEAAVSKAVKAWVSAKNAS